MKRSFPTTKAFELCCLNVDRGVPGRCKGNENDCSLHIALFSNLISDELIMKGGDSHRKNKLYI